MTTRTGPARPGGADETASPVRPRLRWRVLLAPALASLVVLAVLIALGVWQLQRREWKADLIHQIETRARGGPGAVVSEAGWADWRASDDEFRRVRVTGTFLHDREVLVHGLMQVQRGAPAQGFYVLVPLRLPDGATLFVNRGFVPTELRDPARRGKERPPAGPVAVAGLVRAPQARTLFVPANEPAKDVWFVRDVAEMAQARGLERVAPFYLDAEADPVDPAGWPRGGQTNLDLPNNHLQYAFTWFGLALTLVGVFVAFARRRLLHAP